MKKILSVFILLFIFLAMTGCDSNKNDTNQKGEETVEKDPNKEEPTGDNTNQQEQTPQEKVALPAPTLTLEGNVVSWNAIPNANGYCVYKNDQQVGTQNQTTYTISDTEVGSYVIAVIAIALASSNYTDSVKSTSVTYTVNPIVLQETTLWVVGDSTVSAFNDAYYYPRYGYATQLGNYLDEKVTVKNLALSGRSSRSFVVEANYTTLKNGIQQGDYLMIGFGHNDEKAEVDRFANANLASTDTTQIQGATAQAAKEVSFKYVLKHYYLDLALEKGATPILCTPIVRYNASGDYSGSSAHITSSTTANGVTYPGGDYPKAIRELASETDTALIDLTSLTKEEYTTLGAEAAYFHAMTTGKYTDSSNTTTEPNLASLDSTHTNIYGAKNNAYLICTALKNTTCSLKNYVKNDLQKPTKANDLVENSNYKIPTYSAFDSTKASSTWKGLPENWYGTVFGDCGGASKISSYKISYDGSNESFSVGNTANVGKIASSEGIAMIFQQVLATKNISFTATVTLTQYTASNNQTGFGLMIRDDIYIDTYDAAIKSNYAAAGVYVSDSGSKNNVLYTRVESKITPSGKTISNIAAGATFNLSITKVNSTVTVTFGEYSQAYYDFDLQAIDNQYFYIGMYATRGTIATFTNVNLTITGDSVQA